MYHHDYREVRMTSGGLAYSYGYGYGYGYGYRYREIEYTRPAWLEAEIAELKDDAIKSDFIAKKDRLSATPKFNSKQLAKRKETRKRKNRAAKISKRKNR